MSAWNILFVSDKFISENSNVRYMNQCLARDIRWIDPIFAPAPAKHEGEGSPVKRTPVFRLLCTDFGTRDDEFSEAELAEADSLGVNLTGYDPEITTAPSADDVKSAPAAYFGHLKDDIHVIITHYPYWHESALRLKRESNNEKIQSAMLVIFCHSMVREPDELGEPNVVFSVGEEVCESNRFLERHFRTPEQSNVTDKSRHFWGHMLFTPRCPAPFLCMEHDSKEKQLTKRFLSVISDISANQEDTVKEVIRSFDATCRRYGQKPRWSLVAGNKQAETTLSNLKYKMDCKQLKIQSASETLVCSKAGDTLLGSLKMSSVFIDMPGQKGAAAPNALCAIGAGIPALFEPDYIVSDFLNSLSKESAVFLVSGVNRESRLKAWESKQVDAIENRFKYYKVVKNVRKKLFEDEVTARCRYNFLTMLIGMVQMKTVKMKVTAEAKDVETATKIEQDLMSRLLALFTLKNYLQYNESCESTMEELGMDPRKIRKNWQRMNIMIKNPEDQVIMNPRRNYIVIISNNFSEATEHVEAHTKEIGKALHRFYKFSKGTIANYRFSVRVVSDKEEEAEKQMEIEHRLEKRCTRQSEGDGNQEDGCETKANRGKNDETTEKGCCTII